ncbi:MAG: hypothetical protein IAI50_10670 [Candidatus Eremiobacteraeota bacterium]|nr:hypothetical protein [Candidatus Eremiobacteraeota bacterium]
MSPTTSALAIVAVGVVVFLVLVVLGAARVASRGNALRQRIERYRDLPIVRTFEMTEAQAITTRRSVATVPLLRARAVAALSEIGNAGNRIRLIAQTVRFVVRNMLGAS